MILGAQEMMLVFGVFSYNFHYNKNAWSSNLPSLNSHGATSLTKES